MCVSSRSGGFVDKREGANLDNLLIGRPPAVGSSLSSSPRRNPELSTFYRTENDFNFEYPKNDDIRSGIRYSPPKNESSRPHTARPTTMKYYKCHETDELFSHAEEMLRHYDYNNQRKKIIMHNEYEAEVYNPMNERMREQLTGRTYQSRQASRLSQRGEPEPLKINTTGVGDRLTRSRLASRNESRLEKMLNDEQKKPKKSTYQMDPRRQADTRFFGYPEPPRKGTKVFEQKYQSKVSEQINQFK